MNVAATCALLLAAGYAIGIVVYLARVEMGRAAGIAAASIASPLVLASPWLLPAEAHLVRFLFALYAVTVVVKSFDLQHPRTTIPTLAGWLLYFANPTTFVFRRIAGEPRPTPRENATRIATGIAQGLVAGAPFVALFFVPARGIASVAALHVAKILTGYVAVIGALRALVAILRMTLGPSREIFGNVFTAPTPAELWRRYNRPVGQFLREDVFAYAGGLRAPVRATLATFAASSILHEYVFWPAVGSIQGYQSAFFMLHGVAVAATLRLRPRGRARVPAILATDLFALATSPLFFLSVDGVVRWF